MRPQIISTKKSREAEAYESFSSVTQEMRHPYFRRRVMTIALAVNLVFWLSVFFIPGIIGRLVLAAGLLFSKGGLLLFLPACSATLIGVYAAFRMWFPELESNLNSSSEMMSSFQQQNDSLRAWRVWWFPAGRRRKRHSSGDRLYVHEWRVADQH